MALRSCYSAAARREEIFTDRRKRSFLVHLFAYLAVNALLIAANLLYSPGYYWFLFPLIGWGLLLAAHAYAAYRARGSARSSRSLEREPDHEEGQAVVCHRRWRARASSTRRGRRFPTLSSFVSTELHKSTHELGRDRPARVKESATPPRHAVEPRRDLHEAAKEDFIRTVATELAAQLKDGKFDELVLVAPPGVIAELKGALSKPTPKWWSRSCKRT